MASANFEILENGGWRRLDDMTTRLLKQRNAEPASDHYLLEREAAHFAQDLLKGLGPKQSRNFWQSLRLTRYEIPLDSRILRWCKAQLHVHLPTQGLADPKFYEMIMDTLLDLCDRASVAPTVFDAAVFSSFEDEEDDVEISTTGVGVDDDEN